MFIQDCDLLNYIANYDHAFENTLEYQALFRLRTTTIGTQSEPEVSDLEIAEASQ